MKRLFDRLQIWLYLAGHSWLARFVGRWGSAPVSLPEKIINDRTTLPEPEPEAIRSGPGWSLDEPPAAPLHFIDFDPTFNENPNIDVSQDIVIARNKLDIN